MRAVPHIVSGSLAALVALMAYAPPALCATDDFLGNVLRPIWTDEPPGEAKFVVQGGWLRVHAAGLNEFGAGGPSSAPVFLVAPPASAATVTFETRLRFDPGEDSPLNAHAGLVLTRRDFSAAVLFKVNRGARRTSADWRWDLITVWSSGPPAFQEGEDMWLRFAHLGDHFAVSRKSRADDEWEDITAQMARGLSDSIHKYPPGAFLVGFFVTGGFPDGEETGAVDVSFDYFSSPEIAPLDHQAAEKAAIAWGTLKDRVR